MNPSERFLYRKQWKALKDYWIEGETPDVIVHGSMKEPGLFLQTNLRQIWAPLKKTKKRVVSQKTQPVQMMRKGEKAAIKVGDWLIVGVDAGVVAKLATPAKPKAQPPKTIRITNRAPTRALTSPEPVRSDNARKARARILFDKGQISQKEYEWMCR